MPATRAEDDKEFPSLDGQLLVAMPGMADERFSRSVIYMCAHAESGAMGLIVNKPLDDLKLADLFIQLEVIAPADAIRLPEGASRLRLLRGGPVEKTRGFVLHSRDYVIDNSTMRFEHGICLTSTIDILRAIAKGEGPQNALLALGYAGWGAGQLEMEIRANGWLVCPATPGLIFDDPPETKYERALRTLGIDPAMLSGDAGHA